jgi:hypothetical protein
MLTNRRPFSCQGGERVYGAHLRKMTQIARRALRQQCLRADMGITSVNFAIAREERAADGTLHTSRQWRKSRATLHN